MVQRGKGGSLAVTSSLAAIMGQARGEHYGATKGAVNSMARGLAVEFGRHGIRTNAILPGWIETPMTANSFAFPNFVEAVKPRSEEHTSELQSLMRNSYAVFCLKK